MSVNVRKLSKEPCSEQVVRHHNKSSLSLRRSTLALECLEMKDHANP